MLYRRLANTDTDIDVSVICLGTMTSGEQNTKTEAHEHGLDPAQMALAYVNTRPFLTSTIIGATNMEQLQANIASLDLTLPTTVIEGIEAIHLAIPNPGP